MYQQDFDFLQVSDGTGTGQTEDIIYNLLFQKRLREDSNQMCNQKFFLSIDVRRGRENRMECRLCGEALND